MPGSAQLRDLVTPSHGCSCGGKCAGGKDCGCGAGGAKAPPALVYALGTIGFDFPPRRAGLAPAGRAERSSGGEQGIDSHAQLVDFLTRTRSRPKPSYGRSTRRHADLRHLPEPAPMRRSLTSACANALQEQKRGTVQLVSVPGYIGERAALSARRPGPRPGGARHARSTRPPRSRSATESGEQADYRFFGRAASATSSSRIYFDLRNLGVTPEDRALNYAATNAFQAGRSSRRRPFEGLDLERITVHKSSDLPAGIPTATTSSCRSSTRTTPTSRRGCSASPSTSATSFR